MKCGVVDCNNEAVCVSAGEDKFPCCDEHCGHGGDGMEECVMLTKPEGESCPE